jgi:hypothetical protein
VVHKVISGVLGEDLASDLEEFFGLFSGIFRSLNEDLSVTRTFLAGSKSAFLIVTSTDEAARTEARFFLERTRGLGLPVEGVVLNRSHALSDRVPSRPEGFLRIGESAAWEKLTAFQRLEDQRRARDVGILDDICSWLGGRGQAMALPWVPPSQEGMGMLLSLGSRMG